MARAQFYDVAIDSEGNSVLTAEVTVYLRGTTTLATLYSNESGSTPLSNPFNAPTGFINFWVGPGEYDVRIEDTNSPASFSTRTIGWSSIPHTEGIYWQSMAKDLYGPAYGTFAARIPDFLENLGLGTRYYSGFGFDHTVPFAQELIDIGDNFDPSPSSYCYTAPFKCLMRMDINLSMFTGASSGSPHAHSTLFWRKNFNAAVSVFMKADEYLMPLSYNSSSQTAAAKCNKSFIVELDEGDTFDFMVQRTASTSNATYYLGTVGSYFSGTPIARLT